MFYWAVQLKIHIVNINWVYDSIDAKCLQPEENYKLESQSLQKPLRETSDERCCKICMEQTMNCLYLSCKHVCSCMQCSEKLEKCPVCRQSISKRVKIIIS